MKKLMNEDFNGNNIRTVYINGETWFVAKDVAQALGYLRTNDAIRTHVSSKDVIHLNWKQYHNSAVGHLWRKNDYAHKRLINESGINSLALSSQLPQAKEFKHWVTNEVLPSINHTGSYSIQASAEANEISGMPKSQILLMASQYAQSLEKSQKQLEQKKQENEVLKPKGDFYDNVGTSKGNITVGDMSKILKKFGIDTGRTRFFRLLRHKHFLCCDKSGNKNVPTQRSLDMGILDFKEYPFKKNGHEEMHRTPLVTGKGQHFFYRKFVLNAKKSSKSIKNISLLDDKEDK